MGAVFDHKAWRHAGPVYGDLSVGDITQLNVNGVATDFIVVHQGKPLTYYNNTCDGTWLLMESIYEKRQWHTSRTNHYGVSSIHSYLNSTFLGLFDAEVQNAISQVGIPYYPSNSGVPQTGPNAAGLSAKIFLLSGREVNYSSARMPYDGNTLEYFASCATASADSKRIASLSGTATGWWLRSLCMGNDKESWYVSGTGDLSYSYCNATTYGIRPCLIMPSNQKIFS